MELCRASCLWGLKSLLNSEGILTFPIFLLSDRSLIWMWSAFFAWQCRVLLSVYYCEIFKFCFCVFCRDVVVSSSFGLSTQKTTLHIFLISIYNRSVIPVFIPFKLQENQIFTSQLSKCCVTQMNIISQFTSIQCELYYDHTHKETTIWHLYIFSTSSHLYLK